MYKIILILVIVYLLYIINRCNVVKEEFAVVGNITTAVKVISDVSTQLASLNQTLTCSQNVNINGSIMSNGTELYPIGTIIGWIGNTTLPAGWLICNGQAIDRNKFPQLFAIIGGTYQGKVPDIASRSIIGVGQGAGLTNRALGDSDGTPTHVLTAAEMPAHNHGGATSSNGSHSHSYTRGHSSIKQGGKTHPLKNEYQDATTAAKSHTHTIKTSGGPSESGGAEGNGAAHENMMPFLAMYYIIRAA
jgi:microcystin-dependent protein